MLTVDMIRKPLCIFNLQQGSKIEPMTFVNASSYIIRGFYERFSYKNPYYSQLVENKIYSNKIAKLVYIKSDILGQTNTASISLSEGANMRKKTRKKWLMF